MKKTLLAVIKIVGICLISLNSFGLSGVEAQAPNWKAVYPFEDLKNQVFEKAQEIPSNKINLNLYETLKADLQKQEGLQFSFSTLSLTPGLVDIYSQIKFNQDPLINPNVVFESFLYEETYAHSVYRNDPLRDSKGNANEWRLSVVGGIAKECSQGPSSCKIIRIYIHEVKVENYVIAPAGGTSSAGGKKASLRLQDNQFDLGSFKFQPNIKLMQESSIAPCGN